MLRILDSISFLDIPMLSNDTEVHSFENIMQDSRNPIEITEINILSLQKWFQWTLLMYLIKLYEGPQKTIKVKGES